MPEIAPTAAEATAVTVWMVAMIVAPLGLTAGLALLHRSRGPAAVAGVRRRAGGLWTFALIGIGMVALGGQVEFLQTGDNDEITLFEVHGTGSPVYWLAYSLGAGLLAILTLALLPRRHTLRIVLGVPALVAGSLLMGLLLMLYARIDQLDALHMARTLPAAKPTGELSVPGDTWMAGGGWLLGFIGTFLLLLVAALIVADRYALLVTGAVAVAAALAAVPATPDLSTFWVIRNNAVERVGYSPFEIGGPALLWPVALLLPAALVCAIPFLPRWWRGAATIVVVLTPGWVALAIQLSYVHTNAVLPAMMRAEGVTVSKERAVFLTYLVLFMAITLLPVAAVRLWRAARRGTPLPWTVPPTAVPVTASAPAPLPPPPASTPAPLPPPPVPGPAPAGRSQRPGKVVERLGRPSVLTRAAAVVTLVLGAGLLGAFGWLLWIGITDGPLAGYLFFGAVPFLFGMLLVTAAPKLWRGSGAAAGRAAVLVLLNVAKAQLQR
ncbi:hypothetical protein AB0G04_07110 [Actinoplanes sp. NPDC023801]|uniref:hypothetical protein n=1 Tax=Actinoplanes sp. NPDC023801 TaxID=3154595 RepID=UPI0034027497